MLDQNGMERDIGVWYSHCWTDSLPTNRMQRRWTAYGGVYAKWVQGKGPPRTQQMSPLSPM
jgi:hypothetical protein